MEGRKYIFISNCALGHKLLEFDFPTLLPKLTAILVSVHGYGHGAPSVICQFRDTHPRATLQRLINTSNNDPTSPPKPVVDFLSSWLRSVVSCRSPTIDAITLKSSFNSQTNSIKFTFCVKSLCMVTYIVGAREGP